MWNTARAATWAGADPISHTARREASVSGLRWLLLDATVFAVILILALTRLPEPMFGDQALNMLMGREIAEGGRPYAEVWDLKHPGIFFFLAAAGSLFGFNEIGIHFFELLWMLSLAIVIRIAAAEYVQWRPAASLAPFFAVGSYYALTTGYHLTQTEALVNLPLLLSLYGIVKATSPSCGRPGPWLLLSGVSAGVAAVFKVPYVALPVLFFAVAVMRARSDARGRMALVRTMLPPLVAGALLPVVATGAYLAWKAGLTLVWWTFVEHPAEAASRGGVFQGRFTDGVAWFVRTFRVPLLLTAVFVSLRPRGSWDSLTAGLVAWLAVGTLVIWAQVISWWPYHYLALMVPVSLLGSRGLEALWASARTLGTSPRVRFAAVAILGVCVVLYARQLSSVPRKVLEVLRAAPAPLDAASLRAYNAARFPDYAAALATTAFLREQGSHAGPIFVFGDPLLYHLAGREPAVPMVVWGTSPPAGAWPRLLDDLRSAAPPYVFVSHQAEGFVVDFDGTTRAWIDTLRSMLERQYTRSHTDASGTWYLRADLAVRALPPAPGRVPRTAP